jgi:undecaprenyl-phosphate 4-deoxy-4-formamido-L-arabinose transferase
LIHPTAMAQDYPTAHSTPPLLGNNALAVSFVIPVYNEEENVDALLQEVNAAGLRLNRPFEIIIVDDGSKDQTVPLLVQAVERGNVPLRVIQLRRTYGQTAATSAGFKAANGRRACP